MKQNFILTTDKTIATILKSLGFQEIPSTNTDIFTFVNDTNLKFSNDIDMSKITYSNKLFF